MAKRKQPPRSARQGFDALPHGLGFKFKKQRVENPDEKLLECAETTLKAEVRVPKIETLTPDVKLAKKKSYGVKYMITPYPQFPEPTPEACEEVHRILTEKHGKAEPPPVIGPPSIKVAGCGEVPSVLDATMRTMLSANTSMENANLMIEGLANTFGLCGSGVGKGSIDWEKIRQAEKSDVAAAINMGGCGPKKSGFIKITLDMVYTENSARLDALLKERNTGAPADVLGAKHETQEQKDAEIALLQENMLSLEYIHAMTDAEAMEELLRFFGVGVKTASCVLLFCLRRPSFAVDTHVFRFCKWLKWVPLGVNEDKTYHHCNVRVPDHLKYGLHQLFIRHGQDCFRCTAGTKMGSTEWEACECPLEHLVSRTEKLPGYVASLKNSRGPKVAKEEIVEAEVIEAKTVKKPVKRLVKKEVKAKVAKGKAAKGKKGKKSRAEADGESGSEYGGQV